MSYMISTSANYHWVNKIEASTNGNAVLKLELQGDSDVNDLQFNHAEVLIFTKDAAMVDRLIKAINSVYMETV
jgi:hypothetical protein